MMNIHPILSAISLKATDVGLPTSTSNLGDAIGKTTQFLMGIIGSLSVIFIIVAGIQIVTSAGDPARYKRGRQTLTYAVFGLILAIASYAIVAFIVSRVK